MQRWSRRALLLGSAMYLCAACTHGLTESGAYSIGVRGDSNRVSLAASDPANTNSITLHYTAFVESPQGIGEAVFAWWGNESPHHLTFVLALRGLEHFALAWGDYTVVVSVNSTNQDVVQSVVTRSRDEQRLTLDSPFWMATKLPGADQPYFHVRAPQTFIDDAPRVWSVAWIDYYR